MPYPPVHEKHENQGDLAAVRGYDVNEHLRRPTRLQAAAAKTFRLACFRHKLLWYHMFISIVVFVARTAKHRHVVSCDSKQNKTDTCARAAYLPCRSGTACCCRGPQWVRRAPTARSAPGRCTRQMKRMWHRRASTRAHWACALGSALRRHRSRLQHQHVWWLAGGSNPTTSHRPEAAPRLANTVTQDMGAPSGQGRHAHPPARHAAASLAPPPKYVPTGHRHFSALVAPRAPCVVIA